MKIKSILCLLLTMLLCGCGNQADTEQPAVPNEYIGNSPVPILRTGIMEQCSTTVMNRFECTEDGVYVLTDHGDWILFADHGSDSFVKLCARPDCTHTDYDCNASVRNCQSICWYDGYLYVTSGGGTVQLHRMDPDGFNRVKVMDTASISGRYSGSYGSYLYNGVMIFTLYKLDDNGKEVSKTFYYKLDGSMEEPQSLEGYCEYRSDGVNILLSGDSRTNELPNMGIYRWNSETKESSYLTDVQGTLKGYFAQDAYYYILDGIICKEDYATGAVTQLLDTGLEGVHRLYAFQDCLAIADDISWEETLDGGEMESQTLRFYNWDFVYLDEISVDYPVSGSYLYPEIISGETESRIYLTAHDYGLPEYYIEKSEIGTDAFAIHPVELPSDVEESIGAAY